MTFADRLSPATRRWIALGAWAVVTVLVVLALRAVGWHQTVAALRRARAPWLVVAVVANLAIIALWAWQSLLFLPDGVRVRFARMFEVTALSTTATNTAPAFLGEAAALAVTGERTGIGVAAALSVFAQHQMVEGVAKVAMLVAAAQVAPLPRTMRDAILALGAGVTVLAVALLVLSRASPRWRDRLSAMRSPRRLALGLLIALLMKGAEASGWLAVERAFGVAPRPGSPVLALAAVNLASVLSASPGNIGVYEAAAYLVYASLGVPRDTALALGVAGHLCYLVPLAGTGWLLLSVQFLLRRFRSRGSEPAVL